MEAQEWQGKKLALPTSSRSPKRQGQGQLTTLMLRNVPSNYTQDMLLEEIIEYLGTSDCFDFFYLPWDLPEDRNVGYAFVNFEDAATAESFTAGFTNHSWKKGTTAKQRCKVLPARIQGLEANLRHLMDRAVSEAHSHYPMIIWKGQKLKLGKVLAALDALVSGRVLPPSSAPGNLGGRLGDGAPASGGGRGILSPPSSSSGGIDPALLERLRGLVQPPAEAPSPLGGWRNPSQASLLESLLLDQQVHLGMFPLTADVFSQPLHNGQLPLASSPGRLLGLGLPASLPLPSMASLAALSSPGLGVLSPTGIGLLAEQDLGASLRAHANAGLPIEPAASSEPPKEPCVIHTRDPDADVLQKFFSKFNV